MKKKTLLVLGAVVISVLLLWLFSIMWKKPQQTKADGPVAAEPTVPSLTLPRTRIDIPAGIPVIPKSLAKKTMNLPQEIRDNDAKEVVSENKMPSLPYGGVSTVTVDKASGEVTEYVQANDRPLFSWLTSGEVGAKAMYSSRAVPTVSIYVRQDILQLAGVHVSAVAEVRGDVQTTNARDGTGRTEVVGGVSASYRWH